MVVGVMVWGGWWSIHFRLTIKTVIYYREITWNFVIPFGSLIQPPPNKLKEEIMLIELKTAFKLYQCHTCSNPKTCQIHLATDIGWKWNLKVIVLWKIYCKHCVLCYKKRQLLLVQTVQIAIGCPWTFCSISGQWNIFSKILPYMCSLWFLLFHLVLLLF